MVISKHEVPNLNILFSDVNLLSKEQSEFLNTILLFCMLELLNINERLMLFPFSYNELITSNPFLISNVFYSFHFTRHAKIFLI